MNPRAPGADSHAANENFSAARSHAPDAKTVYESRGIWDFILSPKTIVVVISVLLVLNVAVIAVTHHYATQRQEAAERYDVGLFHFTVARGMNNKTAPRSTAQLSVELQFRGADTDDVADRLDTHSADVHRTVQNVLARAVPGDLKDPSLARLRRTIRERVNGLLQEDVVTDVRLLDLRVTGTAVD